MLDNDIAQSLREQARLSGLPLDQVVNEALRRGLMLHAPQTSPPKYRVVPHHSGLAPGVDPLKLNQINDQL